MICVQQLSECSSIKDTLLEPKCVCFFARDWCCCQKWFFLLFLFLWNAPNLNRGFQKIAMNCSFFLAAGGVVASIVVVLCLFWVGLVDDVGFHGKVTPLNLSSLPVALGLYGFCYSGHAVFPNIYSSMGKQSQFPAVLLTW